MSTLNEVLASYAVGMHKSALTEAWDLFLLDLAERLDTPHDAHTHASIVSMFGYARAVKLMGVQWLALVERLCGPIGAKRNKQNKPVKQIERYTPKLRRETSQCVMNKRWFRLTGRWPDPACDKGRTVVSRNTWECPAARHIVWTAATYV